MNPVLPIKDFFLLFDLLISKLSHHITAGIKNRRNKRLLIE